MDLRPGDVVMLKSGGHPLTVAEVNQTSVVCMWMGDEGDRWMFAHQPVEVGQACDHRRNHDGSACSDAGRSRLDGALQRHWCPRGAKRLSPANANA